VGSTDSVAETPEANPEPRLSTTAHPRYRVENGQYCVDVKLDSVAQLFDNRDPAPFRERDLDPALVEYLIDAAEDLAPHGPFRLVFWSPNELRADDVSHAFHAHFEDELQRLRRGRRRQRRIGQVALLIAITLLVVLQTLAQLVARLSAGSIRDAVREGLVILSWVVLWRPVDVLIYEWLPIRRQRRLMRRLLDAPIDIRAAR
jgi:hypothetical protein